MNIVAPPPEQLHGLFSIRSCVPLSSKPERQDYKEYDDQNQTNRNSQKDFSNYFPCVLFFPEIGNKQYTGRTPAYKNCHKIQIIQ